MSHNKQVLNVILDVVIVRMVTINTHTHACAHMQRDSLYLFLVKPVC